jgi:hypothetical protein
MSDVGLLTRRPNIRLGFWFLFFSFFFSFFFLARKAEFGFKTEMKNKPLTRQLANSSRHVKIVLAFSFFLNGQAVWLTRQECKGNRIEIH